MDREGYGPDFDDRLIKLVKENSAIYDVSHPHYRRTPVRMAIWDNIAKELAAPSRFLQTKWKNIRYNYMQEQKCIETGTINTNIRKRRFKEDLSFLKFTAYRRGGATPTKSNCNGSDDSNSYMYPDNLTSTSNRNTYEVIELDHSEDETDDFMPDVSAFLAPMNDITQNSPQDPYGQPDNPEEASGIPNVQYETKHEPEVSIHQQNTQYSASSSKRTVSPTNSNGSNRSSPLLTPIVSASSAETKRENDSNVVTNGGSNQLYSEITIQPLAAASPLKPQLTLTPHDHLYGNSVKHKITTTPIQTATNTNDPIELYCLSLVDCFRAMPRSERERVKFEFAKILKDAHYKDQL